MMIIFLINLLTSCSNGSSNSSNNSTEEIEVQYSYILEGVFSQTVTTQSVLAKSALSENVATAENLIASMNIYSHETGDTVLMDWYVTLDEDAKTLTSTMTIVLPLGVYDFTLELQDGNRQYLGSANNVNLTPETTVALTVTPVIGDVALNYSVTELPKLKFSYPINELATISDPKIGYSIDSATQVVVDLSKITGQNELYLNLTEGVHTIELSLYDGSQLIATSRPEQENVTVVKAENSIMDLIPLVAEVAMTTTVDGGDATFIVTIPTEIVDEVGSVNNLKAIFKLVSPRNGLVEDSLSFSITLDSSAYTATVPINNYYYDTVTVDLEFRDIATDEVIAHSIESSIPLGSNAQTIALNIDLIRRAIISGNLLSFVGINVFDSSNVPVAGATIKLNDDVVAITGSGSFGTPGYVSFFSIAGTYDLSAHLNSNSTETTITFDALGTSNHVLILSLAVPPIPDPVPEVIVSDMGAGTGFRLFLRDDQTAWSTGRNNAGQLGDSTSTNKSTPIQMMSDVRSISSGMASNMMIKSDNTLWATGNNNIGQLGDGTHAAKYFPVHIMNDVQKAAMGNQHSLLLKTDQTLWSTGYNNRGQLGDGTRTNRLSPAQIMTDVQSMAVGGFHSLILKTDNTLWAAGHNNIGQLGDGSTLDKPTPVHIMNDVKEISVFSDFSLILKTDNTLWATGSNSYGQLGDGTTINKTTPVQIMSDVQTMSAGAAHSLILKTDNTLWATGYNYSGQIGNGTTTDQLTPLQVMSGVEMIEAGSEFSMVIKTNKSVWATGSNLSGQFGNGTTTGSNTYININPQL
ncbi:MAG: hypothetical protein OCD76_19335 [Reichenbachiella sp.]